MTCSQRSLIDDHFAGHSRPTAERELRAHLTGCTSCSAYYERHMLLARLDPSAASLETRLARGLGLSTRRRWPIVLVPLVATATAVLLFVLGPRAQTEEFTPRGGTLEERASISVYRLPAGGAPILATETVAPDDELAFTYTNPRGWSHLVVFGVDEHQHVYWFHPLWTDAKENPTAITVETSAIPRELPSAIAHDLDGRTLEVHAIFTDRPISVREVEAAASTAFTPPSVRAERSVHTLTIRR